MLYSCWSEKVIRNHQKPEKTSIRKIGRGRKRKKVKTTLHMKKQSKNEKPRSPQKLDQTKKILFLSLDAKTIDGFVKGEKKCGINFCYLTDDIASTKIETFDAIVFDIIYYRSDHSAKEIIPKSRMSNQKYIMYTSESSQMDILPPLINELYLSRYVF